MTDDPNYPPFPEPEPARRVNDDGTISEICISTDCIEQRITILINPGRCDWQVVVMDDRRAQDELDDDINGSAPDLPTALAEAVVHLVAEATIDWRTDARVKCYTLMLAGLADQAGLTDRGREH